MECWGDNGGSNYTRRSSAVIYVFFCLRRTLSILSSVTMKAKDRGPRAICEHGYVMLGCRDICRSTACAHLVAWPGQGARVARCQPIGPMLGRCVHA